MGKSHLKVVRIDKSTNPLEWLNFRSSGLGGSEIAAVMGMSQWKCAQEVYYNKIGVFESNVEENIAMFQGNRLEPLVAETYEYWDGTEEGMIANYYAGKKLRVLYDPKCFVLNPNFPHLFFSPDRLSLLDMDHGKKYLIKGDKMYNEYIKEVIEIKTISGWAAKQFEDEFNPAYGIQLMSYLMGLEVERGSIITLKDGRNYSEKQLDYDEDIVSSIDNITSEFWRRVVAGREAVAKGGDYDQFCPPPDGSQAYQVFLKKKFANPEDEIVYCKDEALLESAKQYNALKLQMEGLEGEQNIHRGILCEYMGNSFSQIDFGPHGKVTWRANKNGTRTFRNLVQP